MYISFMLSHKQTVVTIAWLESFHAKWINNGMQLNEKGIRKWVMAEQGNKGCREKKRICPGDLDLKNREAMQFSAYVVLVLCLPFIRFCLHELTLPNIKFLTQTLSLWDLATSL